MNSVSGSGFKVQGFRALFRSRQAEACTLNSSVVSEITLHGYW